RNGSGVDLRRDHSDGLDAGSGAPAPFPRRRAARRQRVVPKPTVLLLGTLDTKGVEYAFLRDRLRERGAEVLVVDAGVHEPVGLEPDISRHEGAHAGGADGDE